MGRHRSIIELLRSHLCTTVESSRNHSKAIAEPRWMCRGATANLPPSNCRAFPRLPETRHGPTLGRPEAAEEWRTPEKFWSFISLYLSFFYCVIVYKFNEIYVRQFFVKSSQKFQKYLKLFQQFQN